MLKNILLICAHKHDYDHRLPSLMYLKELGYNIRVIKSLMEMNHFIERPDLAIMPDLSFSGMNALHDNMLYPLESMNIPYITIWDTNPLRQLDQLQYYKRNHLCLFVIDRYIVSQLHSLGFAQARYIEYPYVHPAHYGPSPVTTTLVKDLVFAGTISTVQNCNAYWCPALAAADVHDSHVCLLQRMLWASKGQYLDIFDLLQKYTTLNPFGRHFKMLSDYGMFLQKAIGRHFLLQTINKTSMSLDTYGNMEGAFSLNGRIIFHPWMDKNRALRHLYRSARINLCLTQFADACHERMFQSAACNGFILSERKAAAEEIFPDKQAAAYFDSLEEIPELAQYYLDHESERRAMADKATEIYQANFTHRHILGRMMAQVERMMQ